METFKRRAWRTKSVQDQLNKAGTLRPILGLVDLTFLGIGSIVGAGVYVLSGVTAHDVAGPSVILSYLIASIAALLSALCYAEFATELPVAGGAYNYISTTFGEFAAWTVAWNMILETMLSSSAVARGFSGYLATLLGLTPSQLLIYPLHSISSSWSLDFTALILIALITIVLCKGIKESSTFNIIVCSLNIACICFVLLAGLPRGDFTHNLSPFFPYGVRGTFAASSIVFFAFIGFDYIANTAEESANPHRDLPISIVGSLGVATLLYALMSLTVVSMVPYLQVDVHAPFSAAFIANGMSVAAKIVSCGAMAGITTSTMTGLLSQARLFVILGRDRLLPPVLSVVHPSTSTPLYATLLTGLCSGVLALLLDITILAELVSVGTLYVFYSVCAGVIYRRYTLCSSNSNSNSNGGNGGVRVMASSPRRVLIHLLAITVSSFGMSISFTYQAPLPILIIFLFLLIITTAALYSLPITYYPSIFSVPFFPITPALGMCFCVHLLCSLGWPAYIRFVVWMVIGVVVYIMYGAASAEQHENSNSINSSGISGGGNSKYELVGRHHDEVSRGGPSGRYRHDSDGIELVRG